MTFNWVIRHQKKVLFVLAVVLVVGWGLGGLMQRLMSSRREERSGAFVTIAGEKVDVREFYVFRRNWMKVFQSRYEYRYTRRQNVFDPLFRTEEVTPEDVAWAYFSLLRLAEESGIVATTDELRELKREFYRVDHGEGAVMDDVEELRKWQRDTLKISGNVFDAILRQRIMAEKMLARLRASLMPTELEAWERFSDANRAVKVAYVTFGSGDYLDKVGMPADNELTAYFDLHKGPGSDYYTPGKARIEYVQVLFADLEPTLTVPIDEMKKFYEDRKDLYQVPSGDNAAAKVDIPFPEVRSLIEARLLRTQARTKAAEMLMKVREAWEAEGAKATLAELAAKEAGTSATVHVTEPLSEPELLDVPEVGLARARGKGLAQLAFEIDATKRGLSPVMVSNKGMFLVRPVEKPVEASVPKLADVRERVVADWRRAEALTLARKAADAFYEALTKAGGVDAFDKVVAEKALKVVTTPFFINNLYDANRPAFIDRWTLLALGDLVGPVISQEDALAAVGKVVEERGAGRKEFAAAREKELDAVRQEKTMEFYRAAFPKGILELVGFEGLKAGEGDAADPHAGHDHGDDTVPFDD